MLISALALGATVALAACSTSTSNATTTGGPSGQIVVANAEPATAAYWDPSASFGLVDDQVASLVFDTLLSMSSDGKLHANLATKWSRVSDTELTLTLRTDAKFHDGSKVTPADIVASLSRLTAPGSKLAKSALLSPGTVTASGNVITIKTDKPFGPLENSLAEISIVKKADVDNPDNFKKTANGSGPYKFVSYKGNDITLVANTAYWGMVPKVKTIVLRYIEDADARQSALLAGQVDIATRVGPNYVAAVKSNSKFSVETISPPSEIVEVEQHNGPLADVRVRQAIAYAVDRRSMAKNIMKGVNPVPTNALPTTVAGYKPAANDFGYNPAKAKALLKEAGVPSDFTITMATSTLVPNQLQMDQAIVSYLKAVGITVKVTQLEVGLFRTTYNQYDLSMNTLASFNNDPGFILATFVGATGAAVFHLADPKVDSLVATQDATVGDGRAAAINDASSYLWDTQATLVLSNETWSTIVNKRVTGYERAPLVGEALLAKASFK